MMINILALILECLGVIFLLVLAVELIRFLAMRMMGTGGDGKMMIVVPVSGHNEDAEFLLRSAASKARWIGGNLVDRVICLDCGMDEETEQVCTRTCEEFPFMYISTPDSLLEIKN